MLRMAFIRALALVVALAWLLAGCTAPVSPQAPQAILAASLPPPSTDSPYTLAEIRSRGVLVVGTALTNPFEYHPTPDDPLTGFDVELAQAIADKLDIKILWVEMPFASLIPSIESRKVDMTIAAMYVNPEREARVAFAEPYADTGLVMVARPELASQIHSLQDLSGRKVGVKIGATGAKLADDLRGQGIRLEIHEYKQTIDSLLDLEVGRLDVVINDYLNTQAYLKESKSSLRIIHNHNGDVEFLSRANLGIAVNKQDKELLDAINKALLEIRSEGTFDRLYKKWLIPASIDEKP